MSGSRPKVSKGNFRFLLRYYRLVPGDPLRYKNLIKGKW